MRIRAWLVSVAAVFGGMLAAAPVAAQLATSLQVAPNPVVAGGFLEAALTVTNLGVAPVANVSLELDLPVQVAAFNQTLTSANGTCTGSGNLNVNCDGALSETVTWVLGTLAPGERKTVSVPPQVFSTAVDGTVVSFTGRALAGAVLQSTAVESTVVQSSTPFELALDASADPVAPGADVTYTASFGKRSASNALSTTLALALPAGTTFVSASDGGTFAAGVVTWNLGTVPANEGGTRQAVVQVDALAPEGALLEAVAQIQAPTLIPASAESLTVVQSGSPLALEIEASPDTATAGRFLDVHLTVSNLGGSTLDPVLELRLPPHVAAFNQNLLTGDGVCTISGNANVNCEVRERVQWDLLPLAPGERVTVSLPPQLFNTLIGGMVVPFHAEVFEPVGGAVGTSSHARTSLVVDNTPVFEVALDDSADPAAPGAEVTYTATFSNVSAASTLGTSLTLELPPGTSFVSASDGGTFAGGVVTWVLGTVAAGQGGTRQATVQVDSPGLDGDALRAVARIRDTAVSPNTARAAAVTVVQSGSPLALEIEASPDTATAGRFLDVHLTVTNVGASTLDPVLELRMPPHLAAFNQNLLTGGGLCTISGNGNANCDFTERVQWDLLPLAPGQRVTVSLSPQLFNTLVSGMIVPFRAEVFEPLGGAIGASRHARASVVVDNTTVFEVALDESADPVAADADLTYTVTFGNQSAAATLGTTLTLALPPGTSFVSASDGGTFSGGVVSWSVGTLAAGQGGKRTALVHVGASAPEGSALRAIARIHDTAVSANTARASAVTVVQPDSPLALEVEANPDPAVAGRYLEVSLTLSNVGSATIDPILELRLPPHVASFNENLLMGDGVCTISGNVNASCDLPERVQWDLLPLAPGERVTVSLPPQLFNTLISGMVVPFRAEVFEPLGGATGISRFARQSLLVRNPPELELTLDELVDPVGLGGDVTYVATFGNPSGATAVGTTLSLPLPPGTSFVSASGGGVFTGSEVTWSLGSIPTGRGGKRQATLRLDPAIQAGDLVRAVATLRVAAASSHSARAVAVTGAQSSPPLRLAIAATPNPAAPGNFLDVQYTTTNDSGTTLTNVALEGRVPLVASFAQANATGGADCTQSGNLNTNCDLRERVLWNLASLAPASPVAVSIPPQLFNTYANGNLVTLLGIATRSQAVARHTVRIGPVEDKDGDGLSDWLDNCPSFANPNQADVGGIGAASGPDGIGDVCQCGDVNGNGRVTTADATIVTRSLLVPPTATLARPDLCNVGGSAGCTTADAVIVTRALLVPPTATVQQVCAPGLP
jgi:uncharacterized repeat protein (TIGR01451 family)